MTVENKIETPENIIFSLDIGTRNVVGTIGYKEDENYRILDFEIVPHPDRAMYDGQIHDIDKVAKVVQKVKDNLQSRTGIELKNVAIAAAGRALKTKRVTIEREVDNTKTIEKDIIDNVEMEAIQIAQTQLEDKNGSHETGYYCVGYSVVRYYLDGSMIINPKGHRGGQLQVDLIATFLPHVVVDSLYTVVDKVGLEVINLTLEPIAAINVAIPEKFRLLNLALVDVGAGTSDIAITKDGTIISYAMVSVAGDEITEALSKEFLLDFDTAELLKVGLDSKESHIFNDIVGIPHEYTTSEILSRIEPAIKSVTTQIGEKILEYNEKAPSAIFCIGGGCQIPGFTKELSNAVNLQTERTVIKGTEMLDNVHFDKENLIGPEYITPVGIGFTALKDREQDFLQVVVNEKQIRLFNSKELSVSDALVLIGYSARKLIAERGNSVTYTINGKQRSSVGDYGEPAKIYVNGRLASLDTKIMNKDSIVIDAATAGNDAEQKMKDLIDTNRCVYFKNNPIPLINEYKVNGECVTEEYVVKDGDDIEINEMLVVSDFIEWFEISLDGFDVTLNGLSARRSQVLKHGDVIEVTKMEMEKASVLEIKNAVEDVVIRYDAPLDVEDVAISFDETLDVEDAAKTIDAPIVVEVEEKDPKKYEFNFTVNNKIETVITEKKNMVFVDIFDHIDFDLTVPKGIIDLKHNGKKANYTAPLRDNDIIEISWK